MNQEDSRQFKNFHRLLCERFGHCHDEKDWRRDQISLIEHIASIIDSLTKERDEANAESQKAYYLFKDPYDRMKEERDTAQAALTKMAEAVRIHLIDAHSGENPEDYEKHAKGESVQKLAEMLALSPRPSPEKGKEPWKFSRDHWGKPPDQEKKEPTGA